MKSKNTILISALALIIGIFLGYFIANYQKSSADFYLRGLRRAMPISPIKCEYVKMYKDPVTGEWEYGGCLTQ